MLYLQVSQRVFLKLGLNKIPLHHVEKQVESQVEKQVEYWISKRVNHSSMMSLILKYSTPIDLFGFKTNVILSPSKVA